MDNHEAHLSPAGIGIFNGYNACSQKVNVFLNHFYLSIHITSDAMGFLKWGSNIKARKFDYVPRYYDPAKEERDLRIKQLQNDDEKVATGLSQDRIRAGLRQKYRPQRDNIGGQRNRAMRLIVIIVALMYVTFLILSANMEWLDTYLR